MKRILTGVIVGIAWLLLLLFASPLLFWAAICLLAALSLREYGKMLLVKEGEAVLRPLFIGLGLLPVLAAATINPALIGAAAMASLAGFILVTIFRYPRLSDPHGFLMRSVFAIFYPVLLLAHFPLLLALPQGRAWLIIAGLITVAADSGAYYAGTNLGRHKLCPAISPGKTIEGLLGGVLAGAVVTGLTAWLFFPAINPGQALLFAFILAIVGVGGDLTESLLKREAGVKDSGRLLPGHGGILDRIDSLLLAAPVLYYLLLLAN